MNETAPGNLPWQSSPIGLSPEAPVREPRQRRKPREEATAPEAPAEKPKRGRKPREAAPEPKMRKPRKAAKAKVERAPPETIKVSLKEYAVMRVGEDAKLFLKLHALLSDASKGSRAKVLAEINKVLG